jgi:dihydrofolate reductase
MRKIIQSVNITTDGSCDHTAVIADDELHNFANENFRTADTVLFGRVTYQLFESSWPMIAKKRTDPLPVIEFADLINKIDKIVFSKTLNTVQWEKSILLKELNKEEILKLKQKTGKNILIAGLNFLPASIQSW